MNKSTNKLGIGIKNKRVGEGGEVCRQCGQGGPLGRGDL